MKNGHKGLTTITLELSQFTKRQADAVVEATLALAMAAAAGRKSANVRVSAEFEQGKRLPRESGVVDRKTPKWL